MYDHIISGTMITGQVENASTKVGCHANGTKPIGSFGHSSSSSNCYKNQDNTEMRLASIKQTNNLVESKGFTNGSPNQSQEHVSMTTVNCMYRYTCSLLKCQREVVEKRMHQLQVKRVKLQTKRERVKRKLIETEKRFSEYEEKTALIRPAQTNRGGMSQESSRGFSNHGNSNDIHNPVRDPHDCEAGLYVPQENDPTFSDFSITSISGSVEAEMIIQNLLRQKNDRMHSFASKYLSSTSKTI